MSFILNNYSIVNYDEIVHNTVDYDHKCSLSIHSNKTLIPYSNHVLINSCISNYKE